MLHQLSLVAIVVMGCGMSNVCYAMSNGETLHSLKMTGTGGKETTRSQSTETRGQLAK